MNTQIKSIGDELIVFRPILVYIFPIIGATATLISLFSDFIDQKDFFLNSFIYNSPLINFVLHFALIFYVLGPGRLMINPHTTLNTKLYLLSNFMPAWRILWISWGLLYLINYINNLIISENFTFFIRLNSLKLLSNIINNIGNFSVLFLYIGLSKHNMNKNLITFYYCDNINNINKINYFKGSKFWLFVLMILITINIISIVHAKNVFNSEDVFTIMSSVLASLFMGMLIGKLDSLYLTNKHLTILLLYIYASIQVYYVTYGKSNNSTNLIAESFVSYLAFTMKCIFYLFIYNIFKEDKISYYIFKHNEGKFEYKKNDE